MCCVIVDASIINYLKADAWVSEADLGWFRLRSWNQTTIPESESELESFVVRFGGVGIVVIGIGVGIGVIGIGVWIGIKWRFHTCMYTVPPNMNSGSKPQEACSNKPLIAVSKSTHRVRNTAMRKWLCLFRGRLLCSLHLNRDLFNAGMPAYLVQQWPSTAEGLIGQIWPNCVNSALWCYNVVTTDAPH